MGYSLLSPISGNCRMTSGRGWRRLGGRLSFHRGQDYANPPSRGTALRHARATVGGTAYRYYEPNGFGRYVYVKCDDGFGYVFAHLDAYGVANGARVNRDSIIGYCGQTGAATGPHVHIELHKKFGAGFTQANSLSFTLNNR